MQPGQHRATARILLHSRFEEVFLLLTHFDPEVQLPPRWITPGGGIDPGESVIEAAIRELFEETGLVVTPEMLGEPVFESSGRWDWGDGVNFHTYTDHFFQLDITSVPVARRLPESGLGKQTTEQSARPSAESPAATSAAISMPSESLRLDSNTFKLDDSSWTDDERRDVLEHRWWKIPELVATNELIGPPELPIWLRSWL